MSRLADMAPCYVNGALVDDAEAQVSALDHGLVVGDGVFETIFVHEGRPFALERHLVRLERSATGLGLERPDLEEVRGAIGDVVAASGYSRARLRVTVTAGRGPLGSGRLPGRQSVVVAIAPEGEASDSSAVAVVPWRRNERGALSGLKTTSYGENVLALAWAGERGADEAIFANTVENLCEGTGSNIFIVRGGELVTPTLQSGCLAGITRALVLETYGGEERDLPVAEFVPDGLDEAFLTSTVRGVQPISAIDGVALGSCPGPVTAKASAAYLELLGRTAEP
jgi:branched-chain amino acid aminotransferase